MTGYEKWPGQQQQLTTRKQTPFHVAELPELSLDSMFAVGGDRRTDPGNRSMQFLRRPEI